MTRLMTFGAVLPRRALIGGAVLLLIALALALRLALYDRFLPYVDYTDEVVYVASADHARGASDQTALLERYGLLAPLYVSFAQLVQTLHDTFKGHDDPLISEYYPLLRLASVGFALGVVLLLLDSGRLLGGWLAGGLAASAWAFSPHITAHDMLALPDGLFFFICAVTFWASLRAWHFRSPRWLLLALLGAIAAIYTKLWLVSIVIPPVLVALLLWRARALSWRWGLAYALIALGSAWNFLNAYSVLSLPDRPFVAERLWDAERLLNNAYHLLIPLAPTRDEAWAWGALALLLGALAWGLARWRGARTLSLIPLGLLLAFLLPSIPLSSPVSFVQAGAGWRLRHILPLVIPALLLWGLAWQQLAWLIAGLLKRPAWVGLIAPALGLLVFLPYAGWMLRDNQTLVETFARPHLVTRVTRWADVNLPEEGDSLTLLPMGSSVERLWNRYWGAYEGSRPHWHFLESVDDIYTSDVPTLLERNFRYFIVDSEDIRRAGQERHDALIAQQTRLIKTFSPHPDFVNVLTHAPGTPLTVYVYCFGDFDLSIEQTWGEQLHLLGLDWTGETYRAGDVLQLRLFWQAAAPPRANYSVFVHLYPQDEARILAQADGPAGQPQRLSLTWDDPQEVIISEPFSLALPADLPAGTYRLGLGVYNFLSGERLTLPDGTDTLLLPIRVE